MLLADFLETLSIMSFYHSDNCSNCSVDPVDITYGRNKHLCNSINLDNFVESWFCFKILTESHLPLFVFSVL
jgi:hypothetical protein